MSYNVQIVKISSAVSAQLRAESILYSVGFTVWVKTRLTHD